MKKIFAAAALAAIILTSGTANAYEIRAWMYAHEVAAGPTEGANPFGKD